jgi:citrate lyase subunit beta/citryl-CoA lyase
MRSLLFVPGDSAHKLARAAESAADALIIDLEDSVALAAKDAARRGAAEFLAAQRGAASRQRLFVRVNPLCSGLTDADLDAVMPARPDGIVLPKAVGGADVQHLGAKLAVREAEHDLADGATAILPIATETPAAIFALGSFAGASRRACALTWGSEDLSAALGAETNRRADGTYASPYRLARDLALFAAAAAGVDAIDTIFADFRDADGLRRECEAARRDGFAGKLAIHPGQIAAINAAFTPSEAALAAARAVVNAFEAAPGAGVVSIGGVMYDRPHLLRAERLLARAGRQG